MRCLQFSVFFIYVTVIQPDDGRYKRPKHVVEDERMHSVYKECSF